MKVLILAGWLAGGGAERVVVHLVQSSDLVGADVELGLLRREGAYFAEVADVDCLHYRSWGERLFPSDGSNSTFYQPHRLLMAAITGPLVYRDIISKVAPDVVMSIGRGPNYLTWLALAGMGASRPAWIARDGNNLTANTTAETNAKWRRGLGIKLLRKVYASADCLLTNATGLASDFGSVLGIDRKRISVVPNPIDLDRIRRLAAQPPAHAMDEPFILSVGRLNYQKGHDLLLHAFAKSAHRATHRLVVAGEGVEEGKLRALAGELGIADRVSFIGFQDNPWAWMSRSDLFVLPSRWEGCPNALGEALACGVPSLSSDCRFGPSELIAHGKDGWLAAVEDGEAFAAAMDRLLGDSALRESLGAAARSNMERFGLRSVLPQFGTLFADVAERRSREMRPSESGRGAGTSGSLAQALE